MARAGRFFQGDVVAHGFELSDGVGSCSRRVESREVVAAGIAVGGVGGGDVPDRDQQCALYGDVGAQRASASGDPTVLRGQVGVAGVRDRHCRGTERALQVGVAGRLIRCGRSGARPGRKVLCGGEFGHVSAGLADHDIAGEVLADRESLPDVQA